MDARQVGRMVAWEAWGDGDVVREAWGDGAAAREAWGDGAAVAGAVYPSPGTSRYNLKNSEERGVKNHQI